jgi:hypothetical protein
MRVYSNLKLLEEYERRRNGENESQYENYDQRRAIHPSTNILRGPTAPIDRIERLFFALKIVKAVSTVLE